jgi:hypothetical protein
MSRRVVNILGQKHPWVSESLSGVNTPGANKPQGNAQPQPPPPPPPTPNNILLAQQYLKASNAASEATFSAYLFGNAYTNEEYFIGEGIGQKYDENGNIVNKTVNQSMIWRWASMTKLLGMILFCKAVEDGLINSLDDPVSNYIPEFSNINEYISGSILTSQPNVDVYGTPKYEATISTVPNLGDTITIRHLINSTSGLGYTFWGLGNTRENYINNQTYTDFDTGTIYNIRAGPNYFPPNNSTFANFIAYIQYMEKIAQVNNDSENVDIFTSYYYGKPVTFTDAIIARTKFPLLNLPGTVTNPNYGADLNIIGAVIGAALQQKGQNITSADYCKNAIFVPLEMNNSWLSCGSLPYPQNGKENIIDSMFYRTNIYAGTPFGNQKSANVNYDTLYVSSDPNVSDDGFVSQSVSQLFQNYKGVNGDKYAGGYAESGIGPLTDYTKLLKMIINKGLYKNSKNVSVRILKVQSIEYLLNPKANVNLNDPTIGIWSCGAGTTNFIQPFETWAGGFSITAKYKGEQLPLGFGSDCNRWMAYWGHHYIFDVFTGNYLVGGSDSSFASWTPTPNGFEPDYFKLWQILTLYN